MKYFFHLTEGREQGVNAFAKAPSDIAVIAERTGIADIRLWDGIGRLVLRLKRDGLCRAFAKLKLGHRLPTGSVCLFQYPNFSMSDISWAKVLGKVRARGVKVVGLLHDIEELRFGEAERDGLRLSTRQVFKQFDIIISHNAAMSRWLSAQGFLPEKLVNLEIFDYLSEAVQSTERPLSKSIVVAGNLDVKKAGYLSVLHEIHEIDWNLYGINFNAAILGAPNIRHCGSFSPNELPGKLEGSFGLVWDGPSADTCAERIGNYLRYNNPHKLSLYLRAGLPVAVWTESAAADFVRRHDVGLSVQSLRELPAAISAIGIERYRQLLENCQRVSLLLGGGHFAESALCQARRAIR